MGKRDSPQKSALILGTLQKNMLPKESHERRYYQSFQSFSPFSDAETPENGETAGHLGLVVDSVAVPLPHMSREHWKFQLSSVLRIVPVRQELLLQDVLPFLDGLEKTPSSHVSALYGNLEGEEG